MKQDIAKEVVNSAPPVAIAGSAWVFGLTLNDWVLILTGIYVALQAAYLVWKFVREWRGK